MATQPASAPCRILLLEDEPLILLDLEFAAEDLACAPLVANSVRQALARLDESGAIDAAVLDVNLGGGETCVPVAHELERRKIPYVLHSGDLDRQNETVRRLGAELVAKPADARHVIGRALALAGLNRS